MQGPSIDKVHYRCYRYSRQNKSKVSINPIGIDTEAYRSGKCFMVATSIGDIFKANELPGCLFTREYRGKSFVCYNLKYDSGAFVQSLSSVRLKELQKKDHTIFRGYRYSVMGNKCLTIRKGKNSVHFYDIANFYMMSLDAASKEYLGKAKEDIDVKRFNPSFVRYHYEEIASYCLQDAKLTKELADLIIKRFESYGVYPKKLYSVAYISYQYFRSHCPYVVVRKYWDKHREVLDYAMQAYHGGKFEVTTKGIDTYYEYDLVSAYPFEISNLADISWARVVQAKSYRKTATYAFILCNITIPVSVYSPVVLKRGTVNTFPVGTITCVVTKAEYEYLLLQNCDIKILQGYWLHLDNRQYPYRREIRKLVKLKSLYKQQQKWLDYQTVKILLNSLYGKFVQLIKKDNYYQASSCWNPIYGAIITANCRIRMCQLQQQYSSIVAVHTDSVIATVPLPYNGKAAFGELAFETKGKGIILGTGVYQIGDKTAFRGFPIKVNLFDMLSCKSDKVTIPTNRPYSWREIAHRSWPSNMINRFTDIPKKLNIRFDSKRIWLKDWNKFTDIRERTVESSPLFYSDILF